MSESLQRTYHLTLQSIDSQTHQEQDLTSENGFICNSPGHWFAIRKIRGQWYNLNSLNKSGPEKISAFYLSAYLNSVRKKGYIIFLVRGILPEQSMEVLR